MAGGSIPPSFARVFASRPPRRNTALRFVSVSLCQVRRWAPKSHHLYVHTLFHSFPPQPFVRSTGTHPSRCHRRIHFLSSVLDDTCCQPLTPSCKRRGQIFTSVYALFGLRASHLGINNNKSSNWVWQTCTYLQLSPYLLHQHLMSPLTNNVECINFYLIMIFIV